MQIQHSENQRSRYRNTITTWCFSGVHFYLSYSTDNFQFSKIISNSFLVFSYTLHVQNYYYDQLAYLLSLLAYLLLLLA